MFLIDVIKHNVEKKFITCFIFLRGGESQAFKIKSVLFLFVSCFLAVTKTLFKTNKKVFILRISNIEIFVLYVLTKYINL